jgi:[ribosomal protein S5]-alanine N-acetyltransferase
MKLPFLVGENIYLRALHSDDLAGRYSYWFNDPEVCQYNSHHFLPYTEELARQYFDNIYNRKDMLVLAIILKNGDRHIGNVSLQNINYIHQNAEIAIILGEKDCWGKGYSKEASFLLVKHGFLELNLHRIYCGTSVENVAMQRLASFLGMNEEGVRKDALYKHGKFIDIVEYGVLKSNFINKFHIEL